MSRVYGKSAGSCLAALTLFFSACLSDPPCNTGDTLCDPVSLLIALNELNKCTYPGPWQKLGTIEFETGVGPTVVKDIDIDANGTVYLTGSSGTGTTTNWVLAEFDRNTSAVTTLDNYNHGNSSTAWSMTRTGSGFVVVGSAVNPANEREALIRYSTDGQTWNTVDAYRLFTGAAADSGTYASALFDGAQVLVTGYFRDDTAAYTAAEVRAYIPGGSVTTLYNYTPANANDQILVTDIQQRADGRYYTVLHEFLGASPSAVYPLDITVSPVTLNTATSYSYTNTVKARPQSIAFDGSSIYVPVNTPTESYIHFSSDYINWTPYQLSTDASRFAVGIHKSSRGGLVAALGAGTSGTTALLSSFVIEGATVRQIPSDSTHYISNTTNLPPVIAEYPDGDLLMIANTSTTTEPSELSIAYSLSCR